MKIRPSTTKEGQEAIHRAAVSRVLPRVMAWGDIEEKEREGTIQDLLEALENGGEDGYGLAKYLDERSFWSANSELVEILDQLPAWVRGEEKISDEAWVLETGYVMPWVKGDRVRGKIAGEFDMVVTGEVTTLMPKWGQIFVVTDPPNKGWIVNGETAIEKELAG